jgi:hypothetical protein
MYALVTRGDVMFGVPSHASVDGPSVHYTIVFNVFVLLQLFNQVQLDSEDFQHKSACLSLAIHAKLWPL